MDREPFKVTVGGFTHELQHFDVQEASTPLHGGDSSGQVGTITLTLKKPDPDLPAKDNLLKNFGPQVLANKEVTLEGGGKGFTIGRVLEMSDQRGSGLFTLTCESRLGRLNVYNIQAQPFIGTLKDAFEYYCTLANVTTGVLVDPALAGRPVVFPGFFGELWFHMKQMATAVSADISLVGGVIVLRPIRSRFLTSRRDVDRTVRTGGQLAQYVEVVHYNNREITDELVYPPGGWSEEVAPIHVNAGETVEEVVELSASVTSVTPPVMKEFVGRYDDHESAYTIVGDDGLPIPPQLWADRGGSLEVTINEDTSSLTVTITAPVGIPSKDGEEIGVFSVALSSDTGRGRYSTLRILGTGVAFDKKTLRIPTGVPATETGTEVGMVVDNPFVTTLDQAYTVGTRAAKQFSRRNLTISGTVSRIHRLGDDDSETFGNVSGSRIWDQPTRRWYRVRGSNVGPSTVSISEAEDDLTYQDAWQAFGTGTYKDYEDWAKSNNLTYEEVFLAGLYNQEGQPEW